MQAEVHEEKLSNVWLRIPEKLQLSERVSALHSEGSTFDPFNRPTGLEKS